MNHYESCYQQGISSSFCKHVGDATQSNSQRTDAQIEDEEFDLLAIRNLWPFNSTNTHYPSPCEIPPLNMPLSDGEQLVEKALEHICKHLGGEVIDQRTQSSHLKEAANDLARAIGPSELGDTHA